MDDANSSAAADVSLILWYRHGSGGVPIYAVDARHTSLAAASHQNYLEQISIDAPPPLPVSLQLPPVATNSPQSTLNSPNDRSKRLFDSVRGRFVFDLMDRPPRLWIRQLSADDHGEYRCRVDYRGDRTQNYLVQLQVVGTFSFHYFTVAIASHHIQRVIVSPSPNRSPVRHETPLTTAILTSFRRHFKKPRVDTQLDT
jgi:hypothetical protein